MKTKFLAFALILTNTLLLFGQGGLELSSKNKTLYTNKNTNSSGFNFVTFDAGINTELSEVGSTFFMNKYLVLSNKKRGFAEVTLDQNNNPNNNLFCVNIDKHGNLSYPIIFSKILDSETNEGGVAFSPDQKTIYLTRTKAENSKQYELFKSNLDLEIKGYWKNIEKLNINGNFSIETPFVNAAGTKMYFASDMPGGFGGFDLYIADILTDGTLGNPENLGPSVNSSLNEKHPYISDNYIYFASEGHENYGGYDTFRASITNSGISNRCNLGNTLNTPNDEIAFILSSKTKGYISSNKNNQKDNFDVYKFEMTKLNQKLNALIVESNTKTILPNTKVTIKNEFDELIKTVISDDYGRITLNIEPLTQYTLTTEKDGYEPKEQIFKAQGNSNSNHNEVIALTQTKAKIIDKMISVENIYFDFDKATVKKESELSLNKIIEVLNSNPSMTISINAHTDAKGSEAYNLKLSEKRAKAAYDYLVLNGIPNERLRHKGFGESQLKFNCGTNCTEEEDSKNRRIEFIIQ